MVNTRSTRRSGLHVAAALVRLYVVVVALTLVALAVLTARGSAGATQEAWIHAVIVALLAVVLSLRMRTARRGSSSARRAVAVIAAVLAVANVVTAAIPHLFPGWMRIEMAAIAALMGAVVALVLSATAPATGDQGLANP